MTANTKKQVLLCRLEKKIALTHDSVALEFSWSGSAPRPGQFFLIKPKTQNVFLARPISAAVFEKGYVRFFIAPKGSGTQEICNLKIHDEVFLTGPLGNSWLDFLPKNEKEINALAFVSGGIGLAPLCAFSFDLCDKNIPFDFYAGFKHINKQERSIISGIFVNARKNIIATDDGSFGEKGFVSDFIDTKKYDAVYCCGPLAMMKTLAQKCKETKTPLFVSMEKRMACGVGACLGCAVQTKNGNKRCCADGPVFPAKDVFFDEP